MCVSRFLINKRVGRNSCKSWCQLHVCIFGLLLLSLLEWSKTLWRSAGSFFPACFGGWSLSTCFPGQAFPFPLIWLQETFLICLISFFYSLESPSLRFPNVSKNGLWQCARPLSFVTVHAAAAVRSPVCTLTMLGRTITLIMCVGLIDCVGFWAFIFW